VFSVKNVSETFNIIQEQFSGYPLDEEWVNLTDALYRITAVDIAAQENVPGFDRSSVDGFAVMAADTFGSSDSMPAQLKLSGEVKMGEKPGFAIKAGHAAYIPTGGELPQNADAVVMVEYTENLHDGYIYVNKPVAPGNNVVLKGDDTRCGDLVIMAGRRLKPQNIGVMAALGINRVRVRRKLKAAVISTGNEIVSPDERPAGSQVRDVNTYTLYSGLCAFGAQPVTYGIIKDDYETIRKTVGKALDECDIVLVSGGSSVGTMDETHRVIDSLGKPGVLVHGIAVKPGKPTIIGKIGGKAVVGLPGHPASAYVIFRVFVYKLMEVMQGSSAENETSVKAYMKVNYPSNNGREEFLPVKLERVGDRLAAQPFFSKSGLITFLSSADGLVRIKRGREGLNAGEEVEVVLL